MTTTTVTRTEACTGCYPALAAAPQTPSERPLTHYDTGERAEPSTWTPSNSRLACMTDDDHARIVANHANDFGKVDFDDDESNTIATVWATPHGLGGLARGRDRRTRHRRSRPAALPRRAAPRHRLTQDAAGADAAGCSPQP